MRASVVVGRVGALAVALGIGAAGSLGVASAAPADDSSSGTEASSSSTPAAGTQSARGPRAATRSRGGAARDAGEVPKSTRRQDNPAPAAVSTRPIKPAPAVAEPAAPDRIVPDAPTRLPAPAFAQVRPAPERPAPVVSPAVRVAAPTVTPAPPALEAAVAPRVAPAATVGALTSVPTPFSTNGRVTPLQSAMEWAVFAAVRRLGRPDPGPTPAATVTTGQAAAPAAAARRSFLSLFSNKTPTVAPTQGVQGPTGSIAGTLNAADADGDPLTVTVVAAPKYGTVVVDQSGRFLYTPDKAAAHTGVTDQFTLAVSDEASGFHLHGLASFLRGPSGRNPHTATRTVTVTVAPVNAAPTGNATVGAPAPATGVVTGAVLGADADGDALTYTGSATTVKGAAVVGAGGGFTYTPTAAARHRAAALNASTADRTDTFTVTIADGYGGSVAVPVTVVIAPANTAPVASATVGVPSAGTGVVSGSVTATDADGDPLSFTAPGSTAKGAVVVGAGGGFTYTPTAAARHAAAKLTAAQADKTDAFTVTVTDGHGGSVSVPVAVAIAPANAAPTGSATAGVPAPATGVITGSVTGADADGDALTYTGSTTTAKGAAVVGAGGGFTYTPTAAARHRAAALNASTADRTDTFTVTIADGYGGSVAVPVTVAIAPANAAPVITSAGVGAPSAGTGVVSGSVTATDADGDPLSYAGAVTAKGAAVVSANGAISYTPTAAARHAAAKLTAAQADKSDTFTVTVTDGHGGSAGAPVTVTIAPVNAAPTGTTSAGVPDAATGVVAGAVLGADTDGDTLTYSGPGASAKGTVVLAADGTYTYTPTAVARHVAGLAGATGADTTDTFVVTVADGYGGTVDVPVTVTVSPARITFDFVYGTGSQYWTPEARAALDTAAARLASSIVVSRPVTVTYDVTGDNSPGSGLIGTSFAKFGSGSPGFYGTVVQTRIITGKDLNGSATDSRIGMNFAYPWALGDTVPANQYDFQAVATHELVHTLGVMTGLGDPASIDRNWTTYDSHLVTATGTDPIGADYVWNAAYTPNLTGGDGGLYFNGPNAVAAYGGPVPLYTPGTWKSGASLVHLDPADAPAGTTYLMDPTDGYGPGVRTLTPVELAMLEDLGYTVYQPGSYAVLFVGFLLRRRRRGQAPPIRERHCSRSDTR